MIDNAQTEAIADHLQHAYNLAKRSLGNTGSRPAVGCVLVDSKLNRKIATGFTKNQGIIHAEQAALSALPRQYYGNFKAYITLEPCCSRTINNQKSCSDLLIAAGCKEVIYGFSDPNTNIHGHSILEQSGIKTQSLQQLCKQSKKLNSLLSLIQNFYYPYDRWLNSNLPYVVLKLATSIDAKNAIANGDSKWITNANSRALGHRLRAQSDVIIVGKNTIQKDEPSLDCRIPGLNKQNPMILVLDSLCEIDWQKQKRLLSNRTIKSENSNTNGSYSHLRVLCSSNAPKSSVDAVKKLGINIIQLSSADESNNNELAKNHWYSSKQILHYCYQQGWARVLIESGGTLAASFLKDELVDEINHFIAGKLIGNDGLSAVGNLELNQMDKDNKFKLIQTINVQNDCLLKWIKH